MAGNVPGDQQGDGTWTLADDTITPALTDGVYDVQATATDAVGNIGTDGTTDELTIDTTAPVVTVTALATNDPTPALTGTVDDSRPRSRVTVAGNSLPGDQSGRRHVDTGRRHDHRRWPMGTTTCRSRPPMRWATSAQMRPRMS